MNAALSTGITGQDGTYLAELLAGKGCVDIPVMRTDPSHAAERLGWRTAIRRAAVAERPVDELAPLDAELSRGP